MQEVVRCQQQQQQELKNHHHSNNNGGTGNGSGNGTAVTVEEGISSGDEELSVLPRHTKVVVTGNNRTKSVLVGLHGVVKKAVGLGGWHWLVLTNGIEVKLQRNALSVIEAPTGHEDDDANECDNLLSSSSELASDDIQKCHKSKLRTHKTVAAVSKTSKHHHTGELHSSNSRSSSHKVLKVDLSKLETTALMRYWKHFNLADVVPNPSKEQLIDIVQSHFMAQSRNSAIWMAVSPLRFRIVEDPVSRDFRFF